MKITHRQGRHRAHPYRLKIGFFDKLDFSVTFDEAAKYEHGDHDQMDWNKLCGISFHLFTSHKNSAMVGWRYEPITGVFQLNAYYHVDGQVQYTNTLQRVEPCETVKGSISVFSDRVAVEIGFATHLQKFDRLRKLRRRIWPWFGGNKPAPKDVTFDFFVGLI